MKNKRWLPWVSVSVTLIVLLLGFGVALSVILHAEHSAEQKLADLEPRIARLEGLQGAGPKIGQALAAQKKQLDQLVYDTAPGLDRVGAQLQQTIRSALMQAGLSIQGSQVFTPKPQSSASIGSVDIQLNVLGNLDQLRSGIVALSAIRPRVYVTELMVQPIRRGKDEGSQRVSATIKISALYLVTP